jgi:ABC-type nitrate/sulfonate/bicarbonate transport system substrate-binding protein
MTGFPLTTLNRRALLASGLGLAASAMLPRAAGATAALSLQASWSNDAEFAGYYVAIDRGWYAEAGVGLTYLPGGPDVVPEGALAAGKCDVALTSPDTTVQAIVDQGAKFKIIGSQYQKNPLGVVSLAAKPIRTPKDLEGKTLAVPPVNGTSVDAMLALNGVDKAKVKIVPYEYDPTPLIKGEIDASIDFVTNVPYTIKSQSGAEAVSFLLYDFGFTITNDTVVVAEETLKAKRKELVAFLKASRRGWAENLRDPAAYPPKFADSYFKGTGRSIDNEVFYNSAQKPLIEAASGVFAMSDDMIARTIEALGRVGIKARKDMFDASLLAEIG